MTVQEALKVLLREESIEDFIYNVRERAAGDPAFKGNTWDHPRITRYNDACQALKAELDRLEAQKS